MKQSEMSNQAPAACAENEAMPLCVPSGRPFTYTLGSRLGEWVQAFMAVLLLVVRQGGRPSVVRLTSYSSPPACQEAQTQPP
jgi:hypothetical protein